MLFGLGTVLLFVGIVFAVIQNRFYGYVDAGGILHDSLFMPLSAIAILGTLLSFLVGGMLFLREKLRSAGHNRRNG